MSNRIEFRTETTPGGVLSIMPCVDQRPLSDLVAAFENIRGYDDPAGGYGGIVPAHFRYGPLDEYFLGRAKDDYWRDRVYLLGCSCGEVGCWPLEAVIEETVEKVLWHSLRQPYRPGRDYSDFGPFEFVKGPYVEALRELARKHQIAEQHNS